MNIAAFLANEPERLEAFPVSKHKIFMAHAGVTALPKAVADAVVNYTRGASENHQEFGPVLRDFQRTRELAAELIGADRDEISLLGPTSLGLSLFANGLSWEAGDEILCYYDDYPANVYPWINLRRLGVKVNYLRPETPGEITPELVEAALTPRTRLVALASCHYLTGYRIDVDAIGKLLRERGILFSLDAIQTLGASPLSVRYVDFLSADAHKWLLGPMAIGIVFVRKEHFSQLRPTLLGAWNVKSPNFVAQDEIEFFDSGIRYEPGVLNAAGVYGMKAAIELLQQFGMEQIHRRLMDQKAYLVARLRELGFEIHGAASAIEGPNASGITTFHHPRVPAPDLFRKLEENGVVASLRGNREGRVFIRLSPHFYNTFEELDRVLEILKAAL